MKYIAYDCYNVEVKDKDGNIVDVGSDCMTISSELNDSDLISLATNEYPGTPFIIVEILPDETYRNYWRVSGSEVIIKSEAFDKVKSAEEIIWRDSELLTSDIEIFKCDDHGEDARPWREYRIELRQYSSQPEFPNIPRPISPLEAISNANI